MLSMEDINAQLKEAFMRDIRTEKELPRDLAKGYKAWVRSLTAAAGQRISEQASQQAAENKDSSNEEGAA